MTILGGPTTILGVQISSRWRGAYPLSPAALEALPAAGASWGPAPS